MIFGYDELKEYIEQDFKMFYKDMNFSPGQVVPAILNEYEHAEDFTLTENICIYVFLVLIFQREKLDNIPLRIQLDNLLNDNNIKEVRNEIKEDYQKFTHDIKLCCK